MASLFLYSTHRQGINTMMYSGGRKMEESLRTMIWLYASRLKDVFYAEARKILVASVYFAETRFLNCVVHIIEYSRKYARKFDMGSSYSPFLVDVRCVIVSIDLNIFQSLDNLFSQ